MYNILDYVGDIGGLFDGLRMIASVLIAPFSDYNFITLLLSKLFFVQKKTKQIDLTQQQSYKEG